MTNIDNITIIILSVLAWAFVGAILEYFICDIFLEEEILTPFSIYEYRELNWFGSWFFFILASVMSPGGFVMKVLCVVYGCIREFCKHIFTVGRV